MPIDNKLLLLSAESQLANFIVIDFCCACHSEAAVWLGDFVTHLKGLKAEGYFKRSENKKRVTGSSREIKA